LLSERLEDALFFPLSKDRPNFRICQTRRVWASVGHGETDVAGTLKKDMAKDGDGRSDGAR
jgi:hypothetical protein